MPSNVQWWPEKHFVRCFIKGFNQYNKYISLLIINSLPVRRKKYSFPEKNTKYYGLNIAHIAKNLSSLQKMGKMLINKYETILPIQNKIRYYPNKTTTLFIDSPIGKISKRHP